MRKIQIAGTHTNDLRWRAYRAGDADALDVDEPDPWLGWTDNLVNDCAGVRTYLLDNKPVAVAGHLLMWSGVGWAFAMIDRSRIKGHGSELAKMIKRQVQNDRLTYGLIRVQACCGAGDRVASVFLRAVGFRLESVMVDAMPGGGGDMMMMRFQ